MTSEPCTEAKLRIPESPRSSSYMRSPYATLERPAQPYFAGQRRAVEPELAHRPDEVAREGLLLGVLLDDREHLRVHELARLLAHASAPPR